MGVIEISHSKTLKLTNALLYKIDLNDTAINFSTIIMKINNYIKSKNSSQIGPLIQKTVSMLNEEKKLEIEIYFICQLNNFIYNVEPPYTMESVICVKNCMYAHYIGPEDKMKFAYDKINLTAFEEDIELSNNRYTVFVDKRDDNIVADVFVEKLSNE